ncbi:cytochrome c [Marinilongibacter aquaticus]|uniref:c-type cytochrome n=1 Tax=Marinilongibacter aquaticus TaxID=2975157 RepID=UPI0021BCFE8E|nr:cytochrome c [Marinilongibacter aquaticus]UBM57279.1 cytochrome c [Marinilongibacter aquaticus]
MNILKSKISLLLLAAVGVFVASCGKDPEKTGWEYAPNMYNSRAYEAMTQWRKNDVNPHGMNMREPVPGTIARVDHPTDFENWDGTTIHDLMIYDTNKDSLEWDSEHLINPIPWSEEVEDQGKVLYERNCMHCHGAKGHGDGKVAAIYKGVPDYSSDALKNVSMGHIFHVITHGKGRMWPHASQVKPEERWKIAHYIQRLQLGN